ncbi:hypothetical protein E1B28_006784 [Marasmius oreades]|nr:uncharacterized protein E1B28_006784 [Marasmius oreades]KAG7096108.1 hypothetical protein E1B28_006784 [Marasmius oreades]
MADPDLEDDGSQYFDCLANSHRSPDMQGYAVRLSAFIANICIAILIAWSKEDVVKESVNVVMLQNFVIMIASAIAMGRKDLVVADAHFSLTLMVSPLSMYFVYSTYRFIRRRPNHLYDRLGSAKVITAMMLTILFICWIVFDLLIYFSNLHKSNDCKSTLLGWIFNKTFSLGIQLFFSSIPIALILLFWIVYFIRHFKDILEEHKRHMKKPVKPWKWFFLVQRLRRSIKSFLIAQWDVITQSHRWLFFLTIVAFYLGWAGTLYIYVVDINEFFHELSDSPYTPTDSDSDFDALGYGQLLAAAIIIQPIWGVCKLSFLKRHTILSWLKQRPQSIWNSIVFICTGDQTRNPWKEIVELRRVHESEESVTVIMPVVPVHTASASASVRRSSTSTLPSEKRSLDQTVLPGASDSDGGGAGEFEKITLPRSPSSQLLLPTNYDYDPYSRGPGHDGDYAGLSRHRTV